MHVLKRIGMLAMLATLLGGCSSMSQDWHKLWGGKSPAATQADATPELAAAAAQRWLAILDSGNYEAGWKAASPALQAGISQTDWVAQMQTVRAPYGAKTARGDGVLTRRHSEGEPFDTLCLRYHTTFTHGTADETVCMASDNGKTWLTKSYSVVPAQ